MTQATMMDAWAKVGAEHGDPPMLLERDGDKSIYWMHGKKGEYDGVYAIWHGTTFTCSSKRVPETERNVKPLDEELFRLNRWQCQQ